MAKKKLFGVLIVFVLTGLIFFTPGVLSVQAVAPANDDFDSATVVPSLPFVDTIDTTEATVAFDDPNLSCPFSQPISVWYAFTPSADTIIQTDTDGSTFSTSIGVYNGTPGNFSSAASNCTSGSVKINVYAGVTIYFMIKGYNPPPYPPPEQPGGILVFHINEVLPSFAQ